MNIHANKQTLWPPWPLHFQDFHILTDSLDQAKLDIIYCYSEKTALCYDFINNFTDRIRLGYNKGILSQPSQ